MFENVVLQSTDPLCIKKAESLAAQMGKTDFVATNGWFQRWKTHKNIVYKRVHGEQKDANQPTTEKWLQEEWPKLIA